ncbi:hypothetical protein ABGB17_02800 [Sphaerisporangium sp. B11E5]|uniref:hypothetical protein n=1 Tax=Sphaerisporangium sp. B11E5 TaxID=3153563 RepID=UPI00325D79EC
MAPEMHYELITSKVAELHKQAADERRARQATKAKAAESAGESRSGRGLRAAFGKLRTS